MNEQLRQHVTNQSFVLTMRKTHILAMVAASYAIDNTAKLPSFPQFVTGIRGCGDRGLINHHPPQGVHRGDRPFSDYYSFTAAGLLVRDLLKETGLWQEAEKELGLVEEQTA